MAVVCVIGGGAAGLMAAGTAARAGHAVTLLEKNNKPGRKLYLTGKGRCNVTNDTDIDGLMNQVNTHARFLYSAFNAFPSASVIRFFEDHGVPLKTERGRRVFPVSDRAGDIVRALEQYATGGGVHIKCLTPATALATAESRVRGVHTPQGLQPADAVIVATGGLSYPATGSTGDGYRFAKAAGHTVTPLFPSLTPLVAAEPWIPALAGLSLKNIRVSVRKPSTPKPLYEETGEMLFTHEGVSGPVILSASRFITPRLPEKPRLVLDLKPALSPAVLDERIQRDFLAVQNKDFGNALDALLPKRMIAVIVALSGIPSDKKVHQITREERLGLVHLLKNIDITPLRATGYDEAVITLGGVDTREINPSTLMSKKINGLYFAGEVLDVDAMTGGYNLQIAFSTGYLAGKSVKKP